MKKLFILPLVALALVACEEKKASTTATTTDAPATEESKVTTFSGVFSGETPAADGAVSYNTVLTCNEDGTYTLTDEPKDGEYKGQILENQKGTFVVNADTLVGTNTADNSMHYFLIKGDSVVMLNADKQQSELPYVLIRK